MAGKKQLPEGIIKKMYKKNGTWDGKEEEEEDCGR